MKHADAINRICFSCFKRVQPKENILSSSLLRDRVQRLLPFVFTNDLFPTGICSTCRQRLVKFNGRKSVRWSAVPVAPMRVCGCVVVRGAAAPKGPMTYAVFI